MASTASILSHSHAVYRAKKRAKQNETKEVLFDDDARREFLTGFHKRKLQRTEEKKNKAIEREKQQRLEARRESRKALAEQAKLNAAAVERALGADLAEDVDDASPDKLEEEIEFEDEEQLATVTVVEDFSTDELIMGPSRQTAVESSEDDAPSQRPTRQPQPTPSLKSKPKPKEATFRYETKAARKAAKIKQKARSAVKTASRSSSSSAKSSNKKPSKTSKRKR